MAEKSAWRPPEAKNWPSALTVCSGPVRIQFRADRFWTLSGIEFQGRTIAVESSAFGTAVNFRGDGFLGSAHRLDIPGKTGGVEEEWVTDLQMEVDRSTVSFPLSEPEIECREFQIHRASTIRSLTLNSELRLLDNRIEDTVAITAGKSADLKILYPLMYAWSSSMKLWMICDSEGTLRLGAFSEADDGNSDHGNTEVIFHPMARWVAVYDTESKTGAVTVLFPVKVLSPVKATPDAVSSSSDSGEATALAEYAVQIVNAPNVYRKLYLVSFAERTIPKGFRGTYRMKTAFLKAEQGEWQSAVTKIAEQMQTQND